MEVKVKANAKINLMLDIISKRKDNYHELFMIMQSISLYDVITVRKCNIKGISISCDNSDIPTGEKNIVYKAAKEFFKYNKINNYKIEININKNIPHAAGLAGGSADAAGTLVALNEIYNKNLSIDDLCKIGVKIGADVPFCIKGGTLLAQGIGDVFSALKPLRRCEILLVKPNVGVNTGAAYSQFDNNGKTHTPDKLGMLKAIQSRNLNDICLKMENVFEQFIEVPERIKIKEIMRNNNAVGVCMSGSGPSIFGIFDNLENAKKAYEDSKYQEKYLCKPLNYGCKIISKMD